MKCDANELAAVREIVSGEQPDVTELVDLELLLVGGGTGEVVWS